MQRAVAQVPELVIPRYVDGCVLRKGLEIGELLKIRKQALLYVHPCASERGKLMADVELSEDLEKDFFDGDTLCKILESAALGFSQFKCSSNLGVAKFVWKGREISVFRNGKLKIQRCVDRSDILRTANRVSRLVWAAAFCDVCKRPALECAADRCGKCSKGKQAVRVERLPAGELLAHAMKLQDRKRAAYFVFRFIVESPTKEDAVVGISLLGEFVS